MKDDVLSLPFDQYQRYRLVADLVLQLEQDGRKRTILDVGGRTGLLRKFLPGHAVTLVDVEPSDIPDVVLGDGRKLPFKAGSFDVVAAFDTLEHVPAEGRDAFVDECARVAKEHVVLVGPYAHPAVDEAEELLLRFLEDWLGEKHRYLREHRANTLPSLQATLRRLEKRGAKTATIAHGNVERWLGLMCLSLYMDHEPHLRPLAARMHRFWNEALHESDTGEPAYRHAVVASFAGEPPRVAYAGKADALPPKVLAGVRVLSTRLAEFEAARRDWRAEKKRHEETARTLRLDLAGHKRTLEEALDKQAQALQVVETLRADLAGHAASLAESAALLAGERAAAEAQRDELLAELARHREVLAERDELLAQHRDVERALHADLEQTRSALANAEADLEGHRATVAALRCEEQALRKEAGSLGFALAALQAHAGEIEHALGEHKLVLEDRDTRLEEWRRVVEARDELLVAEGLARRTLEADLDGHKRLVAELRLDLAGHRGMVEELRAAEARLEQEARASSSALETERAAAEALRHASRREAARADLRESELADARTQLAAHERVQAVLNANLAQAAAELQRREELSGGERSDFAAVRAALEADLEGHRQALAAVGLDLQGHRTLVEELRGGIKALEERLRAAGAELAAERGRAEGLRHELAAERLVLAESGRRVAALEKLLEEHRAVVRDLDADLQGHRGALREARAGLEARDAEIARVLGEWSASEERHAGTRAELRQERAVRADLEGQLDRAREFAVAQDRKIGELRAHLSDRWKSLKRALWLRQPLP